VRIKRETDRRRSRCECRPAIDTQYGQKELIDWAIEKVSKKSSDTVSIFLREVFTPERQLQIICPGEMRIMRYKPSEEIHEYTIACQIVKPSDCGAIIVKTRIDGDDELLEMLEMS
jgi:tRNA A58 N-methylase Trm61